jgi:hypothetical protein
MQTTPVEREAQMDTTARPIELTTDASRPRPVLAFLLGLLSVPGSTIAWEVPAGGLWIGLPLGIAAVVLGGRARRELAGGTDAGLALAGIVLASLAIAQMVIWIAVGVVS